MTATRRCSSEQVQATAFLAHPYRIPTIGWPTDIQSWTLDDLQNFYRTYYAPNNCTLDPGGRCRTRAVFALAEKYFGQIPRGAHAAAGARRASPSSAASAASRSSGPGRTRCCSWPGTRFAPAMRASRR